MDKKLPGGYVFIDDLTKSLEKKVINKYGHQLIEENDNLTIYLDENKIDSLKLNINEVAEFVAKEISSTKNIKSAYTADELIRSSSENEWRDMLKRGYNSKVSGDVLYILEPGFLPKSKESSSAHKGTSHGSAFNYDTHVPLIWYGKNIPKQQVMRKIQITDIAATLTHLCYLQRSGAMTGEPILELFR